MREGIPLTLFVAGDLEEGAPFSSIYIINTMTLITLSSYQEKDIGSPSLSSPSKGPLSNGSRLDHVQISKN